MLKTVLAGTTALVIAGTSLVYAQPKPDAPPRGPAETSQRWKPSAEDMGAFADARIASIRAGLKLTAEQEKNWPAMETALREVSKQRADRFAARANADRPTDPVQRLAMRADAMTQNGTALKKLADAAGPLYQSLDEGQKRRFVALARLNAREFAGQRGGKHGHRDHRGGPRHHHQKGERGPR